MIFLLFAAFWRQTFWRVYCRCCLFCSPSQRAGLQLVIRIPFRLVNRSYRIITSQNKRWSGRSWRSKLHRCVHVCACLTLWPMDCSSPGSSVHGISQARILKWLPFPSSGDLLDPGIELTSPALARRFFTTTPPGKPPRLHYALTNIINTVINGTLTVWLDLPFQGERKRMIVSSALSQIRGTIFRWQTGIDSPSQRRYKHPFQHHRKKKKKERKWSCSVMSNSLQSYGL